MQLASFPLRRGRLAHGVGILNGWAVTSYFGGRVDPLTGRPGNHGGMDLAFSGCTGQDILAVCDGWLSQAWDNSGGGWWSSLTAEDGSYFGYGHASKFAPGGNRRVRAGDVIAYVGTSGGSTGPHLHFAYRPPRAFAYADPFDLLAAAIDDTEPPVEVPPPTPIPEDWFDMASREDLASVVTEAIRARSGYPVVQLNGALWLVIDDGDANLRRRHVTGPAELQMLQQIGTAQSGPWVNITPETEVAFMTLPEAQRTAV